MKQILRFLLALILTFQASSCVVPVTEPVVTSWEGPSASVVVGGVTSGMVGYYGGAYGRGYYGRPYYGGAYGRGYYGGYHRPYVGVRPGRF